MSAGLKENQKENRKDNRTPFCGPPMKHGNSHVVAPEGGQFGVLEPTFTDCRGNGRSPQLPLGNGGSPKSPCHAINIDCYWVRDL